MSKIIRLLMVDDHEVLCQGVRELFEGQREIEIIGEARDGSEAVKLAESLRPDVVLMDLSLGKKSGVEATAVIAATLPEVRVLAFTRHFDRAVVRQTFAAGAKGYVLKSRSFQQIVEAVRRVAKGEEYIDPAVRGAQHGSARSGLTPREEAVMHLLAWGLSNGEIGRELGISVKTVEAHKANTVKKLGLRSRREIVRYAVLQGWFSHEE